VGLNNDSRDTQSDVWSDWLLHRRHGDDPEYDCFVERLVDGYINRLLDAAKLTAGMTLADIGAGEGVVAFRAIDRVGPSLRVLLTDISLPMQKYAATRAAERGVSRQCSFLLCDAEQLHGIEDGSVDVVVTRSVLAYVSDKVAALREFFRVLKPGGRISLAEPVFQDEAFAARALRASIEGQSAQTIDRFQQLLHRWKSAQFPDTEDKMKKSPIANYSERDLLGFAQRSGFVDIHLELHVDVFPSIIKKWDVYLKVSPHPLAPPLGAILAEQFTAEERTYFESIVRPAVENGASLLTDRMVYLSAIKPMK